jgi:hypothetical protein
MRLPVAIMSLGSDPFLRNLLVDPRVGEVIGPHNKS